LDLDCGYDGSVNCTIPDNDLGYSWWKESDGDWSDSDVESPSELKGEDLELEANLEVLRAEMEVLEKPTQFEQIMLRKSKKH
jgi:hypothetical protein